MTPDVIITGKISHVMETWPLQLVVWSERGEYDIALSAETRVVRNEVHVSPGEWRPGLMVEVLCRGVAPLLTAEMIRII